MESEKKIICPKCSRGITEADTNFCPSCGIPVSCMQPVELKNGPPPFEKTYDAPKPYHPAGFWIRLGAFWMDTLIILLIAMFLGSLVYSTALGRELFPNLEKINLFMILLFIFYHALFLGTFRTTPGKKFFGLALTPQKAIKKFGYADAFLRTLSYFISEFFLGIGFLWIALDKWKQGWHDKIAKTLIIRKYKVPLMRRMVTLVLVTLIVLMMSALQFNLTWVYQSVFSPGRSLMDNYGKEIINILVTQKDIKNGIFKQINTRSGPHAIKLPSSARDGDIFKVNRSEEEGGVFYIRIVIVERI